MELLEIAIQSRDNKLEELVRTCRVITERARLEKGCLATGVFQDVENKRLITLEQKWEQPHSLSDYFRSDHFSALLGAMKWLGMAYEIRINGCRPEDGLSAVVDARSA